MLSRVGKGKDKKISRKGMFDVCVVVCFWNIPTVSRDTTVYSLSLSRIQYSAQLVSRCTWSCHRVLPILEVVGFRGARQTSDQTSTTVLSSKKTKEHVYCGRAQVHNTEGARVDTIATD